MLPQQKEITLLLLWLQPSVAVVVGDLVVVDAEVDVVSMLLLPSVLPRNSGFVLRLQRLPPL